MSAHDSTTDGHDDPAPAAGAPTDAPADARSLSRGRLVDRHDRGCVHHLRDGGDRRAWFAGPARVAVGGRRAIAPFLRERAGWTFGFTIAVMVLVFIWQPIPATGQPVGIIVFLALALVGVATLRQQTAREFPDAQLGATTAAMRARLRGRSESRQRSKTPPQPAAPVSLSEQLERLAALRAEGAITTEEYDTAKARLLVYPT
jgi:hypothetical protein